MTQHGYIPDEWLLDYAAGALSHGHALLVASHVAYHPPLQARLADAEAIGGAMLDGMSEADLPPAMLENLMAQLDGGPALDTPRARPAPANRPNIPPVLAAYLGRDLEELKWRFMGPGMKQVRLWTGPKDERLWLLRARGGSVMPQHGHRGHEMTLVLTGSYHVGTRRFMPGDLEIADDSITHHQPVIDPGEDCICLVLTEGPIVLEGFIARILQPLIGL